MSIGVHSTFLLGKGLKLFLNTLSPIHQETDKMKKQRELKCVKYNFKVLIIYFLF